MLGAFQGNATVECKRLDSVHRIRNLNVFKGVGQTDLLQGTARAEGSALDASHWPWELHLLERVTEFTFMKVCCVVGDGDLDENHILSWDWWLRCGLRDMLETDLALTPRGAHGIMLGFKRHPTTDC